MRGRKPLDVNNVIYYSLIDTVVNRFLIDRGGLEIHTASIIGAVRSTVERYRFFRSGGGTADPRITLSLGAASFPAGAR